MKNLLILSLLLVFAGCASFGIRPENNADGREGRDYTMVVRAWDKKADNIDVIFVYRINSGKWMQKPGKFNGKHFEATLDGKELPAGKLEYYAWMTNSKGKKITSSPVTVQILSYAQARNKAEKQYQASLSDGGTDPEFIFDEQAVFRLRERNPAEPASVQCIVTTGKGPQTLTALKTTGGQYEVPIGPPHTAQSYTFQWTVKWLDPEFGEIITLFPINPKSIPILNQAALKNRIVKDFSTAFRQTGAVTGNYLAPPVIQARLTYGSLLKKYSLGESQVNLLLYRGKFIKTLKMTLREPGFYTVDIPVKDLEEGALEYSFQYTDNFRGIGIIQADYPAGENLKIKYTSLADMKRDTESALVTSFAHTAPLDAVEAMPLTLRLDTLDSAIQVVSVTLDSLGPVPLGNKTPFTAKDRAWFAALPGNVIKTGDSTYRITAVVRDPRLGDLTVILPSAGFYTVKVKSLAALRAEKEAALLKSLTHTVPKEVIQNRELTLMLRQQPMSPDSSASLFYRTASTQKYRELRGTQSGENWQFKVSAPETQSNYIQYYFSVTAGDPVLKTVTAVLRDSQGSAANDFIIAPAAAPAADSLPTAPVTVPASPDAVPTAPVTVPAAPDETVPIQSYYQGITENQDKNESGSSVLFYVNLEKELGLYDISVLVKVLNIDNSFREYSMERKGKTYSYSLNSNNFPAGSRIDFYYMIYKKGAAPQKLTGNSGVPFYTIISQTDTAEDAGKNKGKKK